MFLLVFKLCFPYFERSFQFSVFEQSLPLALPHRFWSEDEFGETSQHNLPLAKNLQNLSCLHLPHPAANSSFLLFPFLVALKFGPNQWMYRVAGAVRFLTTLLWQLQIHQIISSCLNFKSKNFNELVLLHQLLRSCAPICCQLVCFKVKSKD